MAVVEATQWIRDWRRNNMVLVTISLIKLDLCVIT